MRELSTALRSHWTLARIAGHDSWMSRFNELELEHRHVIPPGGFVMVRADGKAFHTFTRGLDRPIDHGFVQAMLGAAIALCTSDCPARVGYVQSDEISIVLDQRVGEPWFGGRAQKVAFVVASIVTAHFNREMSMRVGRLGYFDARVMRLDSVDDVIGYLGWRRAGALRFSGWVGAAAIYRREDTLVRRPPSGVPISAIWQ